MLNFSGKKNNKKYDIYFSRGANGIDGTLSTALGVAYKQKNNHSFDGRFSPFT